MVLFDFSSEQAIDDWMPMNDVLMGGVSSGRLGATGNDTAAFAGRVSLDSGGGFASVRSRPRTYDLRASSGLELRIRGDGRRYKIILKTDLRADGTLYRAVFETREATWQTWRLPFRSAWRSPVSVPTRLPLDLLSPSWVLRRRP